MSERTKVEVGQVRRKPNGTIVRVVNLRDVYHAMPHNFCMVRNVETNRLSYPMLTTVERWPVVDGKGEPHAD